MTQRTGIRRELEAASREAAGASLRPVEWHSINWKRANRNVRRLQCRIAQAQQQGKKRKVRALQFILTRSYSARCLAVRRVTENSGKRTPGVDGKKFDAPQQKAQAVEELATEDYQAQPLKRIYIPKNNGKKLRPLKVLENEVKPLITVFLKERGLQLSEGKTRITHINEGFDFLGAHIRKYQGKLLIKPSRQNVRNFLAEIKTTFRENLHTPVNELISTLNPKIRGWALFHRSIVSKEIFNYVDNYIFCELERWMQRRHPGKTRFWRHKKYLTKIGDRCQGSRHRGLLKWG